MRANLIPVVVGRKWQFAEGYHAVELRTTSGSVLPPFADSASIGPGFPLNERDESFVGVPICTATILDEPVRSILYAAGIGAASIARIAKRLASAGHQFEVHHFAQSADRAVLREEFDAIQSHGNVYRYFGLPDNLVAQCIAHAMSPTHPTTQIYCSGPPALMDLIERQAREWVYAEHIHKIDPVEQSA